MTAPIGRDRLIDALTPLPIVSLLIGPPSVGKRTTVMWRAAQEGMVGIDVRLFPQPYAFTTPSGVERWVEPWLSVPMVRELRGWASKGAPRTPAGRLAVVRLSGERVDGSRWAADPAALHALLKLTEEPPPGLRLALLSHGDTIATLRSRARVLPAGTLRATDLAEILYRVSDLNASEAAAAAALGSGRVSAALAAAVGLERDLAVVRGALAELAAGDREAIALRSRDAKVWTPRCVELLSVWACEVVTGSPRVFTVAEVTGVAPEAGMGALRALRECSGASPRLALGGLAARFR